MVYRQFCREFWLNQWSRCVSGVCQVERRGKEKQERQRVINHGKGKLTETTSVFGVKEIERDMSLKRGTGNVVL